MKHLLLGLVLMAATVAGAANAKTYNGLDVPDYTVVEQIGDVEIRDYTPYTEANVTRRGSRSGAAGSAFRALAGYIFGGNQSETKMAMTAPVVQERSGRDWVVSFVLPKDVSVTTAPIPNAGDVSVVERPGTRMAVIQFNGFWTDTRLRVFETDLRETLASAGLTPVGTPIYMFYNDPFTLPRNRRNEMGLRLD
ncbi:MAG: heme-binding protein [Pseudomonadota bacterium]